MISIRDCEALGALVRQLLERDPDWVKDEHIEAAALLTDLQLGRCAGQGILLALELTAEQEKARIDAQHEARERKLAKIRERMNARKREKAQQRQLQEDGAPEPEETIAPEAPVAADLLGGLLRAGTYTVEVSRGVEICELERLLDDMPEDTPGRRGLMHRLADLRAEEE